LKNRLRNSRRDKNTTALQSKTVNMAKINVAAFIGLAIGLLLTFPPFVDLIQGK
jgi:hypothetical protein